ncbi:hypothetical protein, partial [Varibaculum sp.]|uniref:hypothetical protein n=1 Tax=Varibaculum sp. TaxID=1895474 RepID=UPI0025F9971B
AVLINLPTIPPSTGKITLPIAAVRAVSALPRQNHPPNPGKPPQLRPQFPSSEGATAPGGSKRQQKGRGG